ncbi:MAG: hypothetical protein LBG80_15765 [Bacteroidales bacterium]|jgi:hypothetical protein|nr:hypothetical protein [Bacteroidales bacterium]
MDKITINQFMIENMDGIKEIIGQLKRNFDSHDFIKRFAKKYQKEYMSFLSQYTIDLFEKVHQQIGRFLAVNQTLLGIQSKGRTKSENIFGEVTENEMWQKINKPKKD